MLRLRDIRRLGPLLMVTGMLLLTLAVSLKAAFQQQFFEAVTADQIERRKEVKKLTEELHDVKMELRRINSKAHLAPDSEQPDFKKPKP